MPTIESYIEKQIKNDSSILMPSKKQLKAIDEVSLNNQFYWSLFLDIYNYYEEWDYLFELIKDNFNENEEYENIYALAMTLLIDEVYEIAQVLFEKYLEKFPNHLHANYNLAQCYEQEMDSRAIKYYKKVLKIDSNKIESYLALGRIHREKKEYKQALKYYKQVLKLEVITTHTLYDVMLNIGDIYRDTKKVKKAISCYKKAIAINNKRDSKPRNYYIYLKIGLLLEDKRGIKYFKKAVKVRPNRYEAYHSLGTYYLNNKQNKKAIITLKKSLSINAHQSYALVNMGIAYSNLDKKKKALELYRQAIEVNPETFQAYINIFILYGAKKEYLPKEIKNKFLENFKDDKNIYVLYLAYRYFVDIHNDKKIDLKIFNKSYKDAGMECCQIIEKEILDNTDEKYRADIMELLKVLKKHTKVLYWN